MKTTASISRGTSDNTNRKAQLLDQLAAFCQTHSLTKTDEELSSSFDSFFTGNEHDEQYIEWVAAIREVLPLLNELGELLIAESRLPAAEELPDTDLDNRLFASVKRHPE